LSFLLAACGPPGGGGGWGRRGQEQAPGPVEEQASPVVVTPVTKGNIDASLAMSSTIEAERQVSVHAEATGRIVKLEVEEGELVKEGQLLARIKYDAQSSLLERAATSLDKAEVDYERIKSLYDRGAASKEELDNADLALRQARLDRQDRSRDVKNTRVRAPFAGTLTERLVAEGGFVTSGQQLFSITDFDTLVARVYVPEKELDRIRVGQIAQVVGKAAEGRRGDGKVARIAPIVDASTGTVKVTITLPPELSGKDGFLPGMYAEVTLTTETRKDVTLVPKPALVRDEEQTYVFVVEGDRAVRRLLEVGLSDDENVEISSGVQAGESIIVAGQAGLKDGALVEVVDPTGAAVDGGASAGADADEGANADDGKTGAALDDGVAQAEQQGA
jgi:RND family efflux transporter MFP subunit